MNKLLHLIGFFLVLQLSIGCLEDFDLKAPVQGADSNTAVEVPTDNTPPTDSASDTDTHTGTDGDTDADTDADTNGDTDVDTDADTDADCGELTAIGNPAVALPDGTGMGAVATYTCDVGYHITGAAASITEATQTCEADGIWSGAVPTCMIVDCGALSPPTNGSITDNSEGTTYGATVTFTCDPTYDMSGESSTECAADGTWSNVIPACGVVTCDDPGSTLTNGDVDFTDDFNFGSEATYTCDSSHHITGEAASVKAVTYTCGGDELWSGTTPTCTLVDCGTPPTFTNAPSSGSATTHGSIVTYSCAPGTTGTGATLTCGDNGTWTGTDPGCTLVTTCDVLTQPVNGSADSNGVSIGSTATYSCDDNYHLTSSGSLTCSATGDWAPTPPSCAFDWGYRREIALTGPSSGLQMLVRLPAGVVTNSQADGSDIRFTTDSTGATFNLTHYIEDWENGVVWVKLINAATTIYFFYGNADAAGASVSFATMFPEAETIPASTTLTGDVSYDHLTIPPGVRVSSQYEQVLHITARKIVFNGILDGNGTGYSDDGTPHLGKGEDSPLLAGGGGGGYGGKGGEGGTNSSSYTPGAGGSSHGDTFDASISMGACGGNGFGDTGHGGLGGGAIWLDAQVIVINGTMTVNGMLGVGGGTAGGGGGSGGGMLITGNEVEVTDAAVFFAVGGDGGSPTVNNSGGGGGGGGRLKLFYDSKRVFSDSAVIDLSGGNGGVGTVGGLGENGTSGTSAIEEVMSYTQKAVVGSETPL